MSTSSPLCAFDLNPSLHRTLGTLNALSVRQPWAWLIVHGFKDFENRGWTANYPSRQWVKNNAPFRCLIHASAGMTRREWDFCKSLVDEINAARSGTRLEHIDLPPWHSPSLRVPAGSLEKRQLALGGIVGEVTIAGWSPRIPTNPWALAPGLILTDPKPLPFAPCKGALGFFLPSL